jgi:hypothetical protein
MNHRVTDNAGRHWAFLSSVPEECLFPAVSSAGYSGEAKRQRFEASAQERQNFAFFTSKREQLTRLRCRDRTPSAINLRDLQFRQLRR